MFNTKYLFIYINEEINCIVSLGKFLNISLVIIYYYIHIYSYINLFYKMFLFRLKSCEAAYDLLNKYKNSYQSEVQIIDESYVKLNNVAPLKMKVRDLTETTKVSIPL